MRLVALTLFIIVIITAMLIGEERLDRHIESFHNYVIADSMISQKTETEIMWIKTVGGFVIGLLVGGVGGFILWYIKHRWRT